jgi:hypothetical protein
MTEPDQDRVDPEMLALLRADFAHASAAVKERVSSRVAHSVGALALSGGTPGAQAALAARPATGLWLALRAHQLGFFASFALGAACGAGLYAAARAPALERVVYVDRPASSAVPAVSSVPLASRAAEAAPAMTPPTAALSAVVPALSVSGDRGGMASLAEQQALLDVARSAFAQSDYAATLTALARHFQRYPKSVLGEEREALEIKTLAAAGRIAEAKARAARFKAQFPQSLLLPSVQDSIGAIP